MILSHSIALDPTDAQRRYFTKAAGCDRFCWNYALEEWNRRYAETRKTPDWMQIRKDFNEFKYEAFPWLKGIHRDAHSDAFERLGQAWKKHFNNPNQTGRPVFHKKGRKDSFYCSVDNGTKFPRVEVDGFKIRLSVIGWIRMTEELRFNGKITGVNVFRIADRWFASIRVEVLEYHSKKQRVSNSAVGVDLGINHAATLSTGEQLDAPKPLSKALKKLRRLDRKISRQLPGGKNQQRIRNKFAKIHAHIANIRRDFWHKLTTRLCRENQAIAIEDLNVKGMIQNSRLSKSFKDVAIGMLKPMLNRKSLRYGNTIVKVDRWFPSSKTCSRCKHVKDDLKQSDRVFRCHKCGLVIDRDVNAAINLRDQIPAACRESMPVDRERLVEAPRETGTLRPVCSGGRTLSTVKRKQGSGIMFSPGRRP